MSSIGDYKNRMTSPVGAIRINPKTGAPIGQKRTVKPAKKSAKRK